MKPKRITAGAYGQLLTTLVAMGATKCPECRDYMIHTQACRGWDGHFGGNGEVLNRPYKIDLSGVLEAEELDAETLNAQEAA